MENIRQYILSVIAAALICGVVNGISKKGKYHAVIKLISGLFLTITIISPLTDLQFPDPSSYFDNLSLEGDSIVASAQAAAEEEQLKLIQTRTEALILEKAESLNADISANVLLSEESMIPQEVELSGAVSPYSKKMLTLYIAENLGINEENQIWK